MKLDLKAMAVALVSAVWAFLNSLWAKLKSGGKAGTVTPAKPVTASATAEVTWMGWSVAFLKHLVLYPAVAIASVYLFVHALDFFDLGSWFAWHVASVVWWALAGLAYYVLVFVEHQPKDTVVKWMVIVLVPLNCAAYGWHYAKVQDADELSAAQYAAMYASSNNAACRDRAKKAGLGVPEMGIISMPPAEKAEDVAPAPVAPTPAPAPVKAVEVPAKPKAAAAKPAVVRSYRKPKAEAGGF